MNPVPVIVIVVSGDPVARTGGESEDMVGCGLSTVKSTLFDDPPPGEGFVTTTANFPPVARSLDVSCMVNWVPLTYFGVCADPL